MLTYLWLHYISLPSCICVSGETYPAFIAVLQDLLDPDSHHQNVAFSWTIFPTPPLHKHTVLWPLHFAKHMLFLQVLYPYMSSVNSSFLGCVYQDTKHPPLSQKIPAKILKVLRLSLFPPPSTTTVPPQIHTRYYVITLSVGDNAGHLKLSSVDGVDTGTSSSENKSTLSLSNFTPRNIPKRDEDIQPPKDIYNKSSFVHNSPKLEIIRITSCRDINNKYTHI